MEDYELFGQDLEEEGAGLGLGAMTQPQPMDLQAAVRPAANPEEVAGRRNMWSQIVTKFKTNPNLQRAIGLAGAQLMQPIKPGQTRAGNIGQAAVIGTNAYQMGEKADFERGLRLKQEERAASADERAQGAEERQQDLHPGAVEAQETARQASLAGTEATRARTELTGLQIEDAIRTADEKQDAAPLRALLREVETQEAEIKKSIPVDAQVQARLDDLRASTVKLKAAEEQLATAGVARKAEEEKGKTADEMRRVREELQRENPEEYKDMMLKRGKYSTQQRTSIDAQLEGYAALWKMGTPEEKAARPLNVYVKDLMLKSKSEDRLKVVTNAIQAAALSGEPVPPEAAKLINSLIKEMSPKEAAAAAPAAAPAKEPAGTRADPYIVKDDAGKAAVPEGKVYKGPDGVFYIKGGKKKKASDDDSMGVAP